VSSEEDQPVSFASMIPPKVKQDIAEAKEREQEEREQAFADGREKAMKRAGYHDPSEPRHEPAGDDDEEPRARATDPPESHAAAASVVDLSERQAAIVKVFRIYGSMEDDQLVERYGKLVGLYPEQYPQQSASGIRTRRHELTVKGVVVKTGSIKKGTGRMASTWSVA
jgi:hypothetical protein